MKLMGGPWNFSQDYLYNVRFHIMELLLILTRRVFGVLKVKYVT